MAIKPTDAVIGRDVAVEITAYTGGMLPSIKFWATAPNTEVETIETTNQEISVTRSGKKAVVMLSAGGSTSLEVKEALEEDPSTAALFFLIEVADGTINITGETTVTFTTEEKERLTCKNVNTTPEGESVDTTNLNSRGYMETAEESGVHQLKFSSSECILINDGFASTMLFHAKANRLHATLFVVWGSDSVNRTEFNGRFDVNEFNTSHDYAQTGAYNVTFASSGRYTWRIIPNG